MYLITGASGIVGSHLMMNLLKKGLPIRAIYRSDAAIEKAKSNFKLYGNDTLNLFDKIEWVPGDVTDILSLEDALMDIDYVFHCAATVSFKKSDFDLMQKVNVEGTANLVNCCLKSDVKKLCHVSSTAAIGNSDKEKFITEKLPWKKGEFTSNYSITKYQAEMEVWRGSEEGLDVVIVNPSIIIGAGDWSTSSAELFNKVWTGLKFYTLGKTAFVDVRDVAKAMDELLHSSIKNEKFLLCSENWTYQKLFDNIAKVLGKNKPTIKVRPWLLGIIWRFEAVRSFLFNGSPIVTKETAHSSMSTKEYSADKIKEALSFEFIGIEDAINQTGALFLRSKGL